MSQALHSSLLRKRVPGCVHPWPCSLTPGGGSHRAPPGCAQLPNIPTSLLTLPRLRGAAPRGFGPPPGSCRAQELTTT